MTKAEKIKARNDAKVLALLLYDLYKKQKQNGKIASGQNNAYKTNK